MATTEASDAKASASPRTTLHASMKVISAGLAVVVLALGAGTALAATTKHPTEFTKFKAASGYAGVKGQIDSSNGECVKNRKITIIDENNKHKVASVKTNSKGKFESP